MAQLTLIFFDLQFVHASDLCLIGSRFEIFALVGESGPLLDLAPSGVVDAVSIIYRALEGTGARVDCRCEVMLEVVR